MIDSSITLTSKAYILLKNGLIIDGTGKKGESGDLLINGEKIEAISHSSIDIDCETIDCTGLVISPGFIDVHSHMDSIVMLEGYDRLKSPFTAQGITTLVTGNCGYSSLGLQPPQDGKRDRNAVYTMDDYVTHVERVGLSHNVVTLVGHGTSQMSIRGMDSKPLEPEESKLLHGLIAEAMDQGAAGVSFGLGYEPGIYALPKEVSQITELAKKREKIVTVHGRAYSGMPATPGHDELPQNVVSLKENIDLARETGVRLQYSHLMFAGAASHPTYRQCLDVLDEAIADGVDIMIDTYPYHCGFTFINVLLPAWFLAGLPDNYHDKAMVERVRQTLNLMGERMGFGFGDIQLMHINHPDYEAFGGMFLDEAAGELGIDPAQLVVELSEKTGGTANILNHNYSNMEIIDALIRHPACLFMTDSLVSTRGLQNPASFGAFPLLLEYARDRELIPLEEAVRKMTGASADRVNLKDRGYLRRGLASDITIFDSDRVRDNNTITATSNEPTGIEYVFINGRLVKKDGTVDDGIQAGKAIRI
jgi:N-acyl-D-amino-acid deacylase